MIESKITALFNAIHLKNKQKQKQKNTKQHHMINEHEIFSFMKISLLTQFLASVSAIERKMVLQYDGLGKLNSIII